MTQQELELPKGWAETNIGSISELFRGVTYKKEKSQKNKADGLIPVLRANNFNETFVLDDLVYLPKDLIKPEQIILKNDIIISMSSGSKHLVGKSAMAKSDMSCAFGAFCGLVRPTKSIYGPILGFFFQSPEYRKKISSISLGININNLRREFIESLRFLLPPLNEQKRIVSKIGELFSKIDSTKQSLEHTKLQLVQYSHSLLKSAFEGKLTEKWREVNKGKIESIDGILHIIDDDCKNSNYKIENENQLSLPDNWKILKIGRAIIFLGSGITPKGGKINYHKSGIPFIRSQNVYSDGLHLENIVYVTKELHEKMPRSHTKDRDVLLNITGASIGRSCIIPDKFGSANVNQHVCILRFHPKINSAFLSYWLNSPKFQGLIFSVQQGETRQALNFDQITKMPFPFCSEQEQEQIVSQLEQGFSLIENSQRIVNSTLQNLETMRMSVLKQAFEGKLVPQDPNDEPAKILLEQIKKQKS